MLTFLVSAQEESPEFETSSKNGLEIIATSEVHSLIENRIKANCTFGTTGSRDLCDVYPKIMGYKIQILVTNNRKEADQILSSAKAKYASLLPVMIYKSPNFRVLMGSYKSKESGLSDLNKVRRSFSNSVLTKQPVLCESAK